MKTVVKAGLVAASLAGGMMMTMPALAQGAGAPAPDPNRAAQQAIDVRQSVMTLISWSMGPMRGMVQGNAEYDAERIQLSADRMAALAPMIVEAFAADTRESGLESEALPAVWDSHETFNEKTEELVAAIAQLKQAADADDQEASMAAVQAIGPACGSCHDDYRVE
jgi:cytochrome c556